MPTLRLRLVVLAALVAVALASAAAPSAGPEATPGAAAPPATSDPAECTVAPRPYASFAALARAPGPAPDPSALPEEVAAEADLPAGDPTDAATAAEIAAAVRLYLACVNAWDLARLMALASDAYVRRFVAEEGPVTPGWYAQLATPVPAAPGFRTALLAVRDVRVLPDGRVGAVVLARIAMPPHDTVTFFVFVRAGDRWLLDDAVEVLGP